MALYKERKKKTYHRLEQQTGNGSEENDKVGNWKIQSSVSDMIRCLDWRSLDQRRVNYRLHVTTQYKICNHRVAIVQDRYLNLQKVMETGPLTVVYR